MKHTLLSIFCLCLFLASCANDNVSPITKKGGSVIINIDNVIGNQNLKYDTSYSIASGEKYTIKKLKYYISNIQFMKSDGSVTTLQQDSSYFLVDESNAASMVLSLPQVEIGKYKAVRLMIGVDSAKSMAPLEKRQGVLDMSGLGQDMYWTWLGITLLCGKVAFYN
ncbi:MAG: MbnP family protein [Bacteroidota bacterium]